MSSGRYYYQLLSSFCVTFLVLLFTSSALAQDASNKRGFQPGNSFAIGDFETINTTNGNLMLRFPLGALPAGRNGLSAGINLHYNSRGNTLQSRRRSASRPMNIPSILLVRHEADPHSQDREHHSEQHGDRVPGRFRWPGPGDDPKENDAA